MSSAPDDAYSFIVIGAGSAGATVAARLASTSNVRVLLLEAGGSDRSWKIQMPTAMMEPLKDPRLDWGYSTEAEPGLNGRCLRFFRGRALGGTSSINGMVYIRGHARDFDRWAADEDCPGWSFAEVLPYFRRAETYDQGGSLRRGDSGPLQVRRPSCRNPLSDAFMKAGVQAGYEYTDDINGERQEGFGRMDQTISNGVRWNTANAYLRGPLSSPGLNILTGAEATGIIFEGRKAVGVRYMHQGKEKTARAQKEIILSAGAIRSPQLLMLSGIGPAPALRDLGMTPLVERIGVGKNLQDHVETTLQFGCLTRDTLDLKLGLPSRALIGLRWFLSRQGLGATNHFESCAFIRSRAGIEHPDIEVHFLPTTVDYDGSIAQRPGFEALIDLLRPSSRGEVGQVSDER